MVVLFKSVEHHCMDEILIYLRLNQRREAGQCYVIQSRQRNHLFSNNAHKKYHHFHIFITESENHENVALPVLQNNLKRQ